MCSWTVHFFLTKWIWNSNKWWSWVWMTNSVIQPSQSAKASPAPELALLHHCAALVGTTKAASIWVLYNTIEHNIHTSTWGWVGCYLCPHSTTCRSPGAVSAAQRSFIKFVWLLTPNLLPVWSLTVPTAAWWYLSAMEQVEMSTETNVQQLMFYWARKFVEMSQAWLSIL